MKKRKSEALQNLYGRPKRAVCIAAMSTKYGWCVGYWRKKKWCRITEGRMTERAAHRHANGMNIVWHSPGDEPMQFKINGLEN